MSIEGKTKEKNPLRFIEVCFALSMYFHPYSDKPQSPGGYSQLPGQPLRGDSCITDTGHFI